MMASENERRRLAIEEQRLEIDKQQIAVLNNLQRFVDKFVSQD